MECKNGDDSMGASVASCAADGGVGGFAWKTVFFEQKERKRFISLRRETRISWRRVNSIFNFAISLVPSPFGNTLLSLGFVCVCDVDVLTEQYQHDQNARKASYQIEHQLQISANQI